MLGKTWSLGGLLRDMQKSEVGQKWKRVRARFEYFHQIMKDMGCGTFREMKELTWDRVERRGAVLSNQSQDCILDDDEIGLDFQMTTLFQQIGRHFPKINKIQPEMRIIIGS